MGSAEQQVAVEFNSFRQGSTATDQVSQRFLADARKVELHEGDDGEDLQTFGQHLQEKGILPGVTITNVRDGEGENDTVVTHDDGTKTPDADLEIMVNGHEYGAKVESGKLSYTNDQSANVNIDLATGVETVNGQVQQIGYENGYTAELGYNNGQLNNYTVQHFNGDKPAVNYRRDGDGWKQIDLDGNATAAAFQDIQVDPNGTVNFVPKDGGPPTVIPPGQAFNDSVLNQLNASEGWKGAPGTSGGTPEAGSLRAHLGGTNNIDSQLYAAMSNPEIGRQQAGEGPYQPIDRIFGNKLNPQQKNDLAKFVVESGAWTNEQGQQIFNDTVLARILQKSPEFQQVLLSGNAPANWNSAQLLAA